MNVPSFDIRWLHRLCGIYNLRNGYLLQLQMWVANTYVFICIRNRGWWAGQSTGYTHVGGISFVHYRGVLGASQSTAVALPAAAVSRRLTVGRSMCGSIVLFILGPNGSDVAS
jgi:hypothetical protein